MENKRSFIPELELARRRVKHGILTLKRFTELCELLGVKVTPRQASKFCNGKGIVRNYLKNQRKGY